MLTGPKQKYTTHQEALRKHILYMHVFMISHTEPRSSYVKMELQLRQHKFTDAESCTSQR